MNKKVRSDSIAFKLALTFVVSVVIQSLLMTALLSLGGVIGQSRENAYQIFSEKVKNRAVTIEGETGSMSAIPIPIFWPAPGMWHRRRRW